MDNNELYKFIDPFSCDKFNNLKGKDLQKLLVFINNYHLCLRDNLGLNKNISYGLELEYENIQDYHYINMIKSRLFNTDWTTKYDATLNLGIEINSPILFDSEKNWLFLDDLCKFLQSIVNIGEKSGGHIHIGTQILGSNKSGWLHFLKLWSVYENIIFRFTNGDFLTGRKGIAQYAMPMMKDFYNYYTILINSDIKDIIIFLKSSGRYQAVNFLNIKEDNLNDILFKNTIEFRSPNSSLNSIVWQNNVNFLTKMLLYCVSDNYNDDIINNRYNINKNEYNNLNIYDEIFLEQTLEFVDLIFTNNIDKIYFLKQYLKSFEIKKEKEHKFLMKKRG